MAKIIRQLHCLRCGKNWWPRSEVKPKACPKCKRYDWNEEDVHDLKRQLRQVRALINN